MANPKYKVRENNEIVKVTYKDCKEIKWFTTNWTDESIKEFCKDHFITLVKIEKYL